MRKLLIGLAIVLTSCAGQVDLGRAVQQLQRPSASSPAAAAADATAEAVKQVIETADRAQEKAFATGNPFVMRDTATADYYDELTQINSDLARGGVTGFTLVGIEWGEVTISGTTAAASADRGSRRRPRAQRRTR